MCSAGLAASGLASTAAALVLVGVGSAPLGSPPAARRDIDGRRVSAAGASSAEELRNFYAAADVLVVPSIATPTFREPWGLVVNEAMNQHLPVIASDAVGAAAGGLVRDRRNGLVVPAGDSRALAGALRALAARPGAARAPGRGGRARRPRATRHEAWARGFSAALAASVSPAERW